MRTAHLSLLAVVVVWAGSFSVIKQLLDDGVAAGDIAIIRYVIAVPGFAYILWRARGLPGLTRRESEVQRKGRMSSQPMNSASGSRARRLGRCGTSGFPA